MFFCNKKTSIFFFLKKKFNKKPNLIIKRKFEDSESYVESNFYKKKNINLIYNIYGKINNRIVELLMFLYIYKHKKFKINLMLPYFPYSRQDRKEKKKNNCVSFFFLLNLLKKFNVNKIITFDLHTNLEIKNKFLINLNTIPIINKIISNLGNKLIIVFPDYGSLKRYKKLKNNNDYCIFEKKRKNGKIIIKKPFFKNKRIKKDFLIVDDIIDSGRTISKISGYLKKKYKRIIYLYVTHFLIKKKNFIKLYNKKNIKKIFTTNTYIKNYSCNKINVIRIQKLFKKKFFK
ncbi:ribose-phosphate diphosphokinase [Candidatus Vidania fulgoroideorum]